MEMPVSSLEMATTGTLYFAERQDGFELFFFAGDGIDQRPALGDLEACFDGGGHGRCRWTAERRRGPARFPGLDEKAWLGLVRVDGGDARVDVEHGGAGGDLFQRVLDDVSKLPACISAASFLRPVGLIRSPITQKGWSKPMTISRVAEATMVRVISFGPQAERS
jgi:hypothetical protein